MDVYYHWMPGDKKAEVDALSTTLISPITHTDIAFLTKMQKGKICRNGFASLILEKYNYFKFRVEKDICQI